MLKSLMPVAMLLASSSLAADPASFTVESAAKGLRVRFATFDGTADKVAYDEAKGTLTLTGSVDLTQRTASGLKKVVQGQVVVYSFRDGALLYVADTRLKQVRFQHTGPITDLFRDVRVVHPER